MKVWRRTELGTELSWGWAGRRLFPTHTHDAYQVAVTPQGRALLRCRGAEHGIEVGAFLVVPPGEAHSVEIADVPGWTCETVHLDATLMRRAMAELGRGPQRLPRFAELLVRDDRLVARFRALFAALRGGGASRLEQETCLLAALMELVRRAADGAAGDLPTLRYEPRAVKRAREHLEAHAAGDASLSELAALAGVSPFHLARLFKRHVGVPPHAYQAQLRVERAKALLLEGLPPAAVAARAGYADQSHLSRQFKRLAGVTPGRYAEQRKIVQS